MESPGGCSFMFCARRESRLDFEVFLFGTAILFTSLRHIVFRRTNKPIIRKYAAHALARATITVYIPKRGFVNKKFFCGRLL
jgi:hypothetical protein